MSSANIDERSAAAAIDAYMSAVSDGDYAGAWSMLAPRDQQAYGSESTFASDWTAFTQSSGGFYTIQPLSNDPGLFAQWISSRDPGGPPLERAYMAQVDFPRLADNPAGFEILLAAPNAAGEWRIWQVR